MFRGSFTSIVTPFTDTGLVDEVAFQRLLERQLESSIEGLLMFSTVGETEALSSDERKSLIEMVQKRAEGHVFVVAGIGDTVTAHAIESVRELDWVGVDAVAVRVPAALRPGQAGMSEHVRHVASAADSPVLIVNAPSHAATSRLSVDSVVALAEQDNIRGLIDEAFEPSFVSQLLEATDEEFGVFVDDDRNAVAALALGADGLFSSVANIAPTPIATMVEAALNGRADDAREQHHALFALMNAVSGTDIVNEAVTIKAALAALGLIDDHLRLPLTPLDSEHRAAIRDALDELASADTDTEAEAEPT